MSDLNYTVYINKFSGDDDANNTYAIIQTSNQYSDDPDDLGGYFDLTHATIKHSITDLNAVSALTFTINSNFESVIRSKTVPNIEISNSLNIFLHSLIGRTIEIVVNTPETKDNGSFTKTVFVGYISKKPFSVSVKSGTQFILLCKTVLSQLNQMSSNDSWNTTTKQFKSIFSTIAANTINKDVLFNGIVANTLPNVGTAPYVKSNIQFKDIGGFDPLPNDLWALIVPNKTKLAVLREILIAYNRIIWQHEDGSIYVQPLYINDAADGYTVNINVNNIKSNLSNGQGNYLDIQGSNNAAETINRVDAIFGVPVYGAYKGNPNIDSQDSQIFASAPYINPKTELIETLPNTILTRVADYTDIYKNSVRLYNSGKWAMVKQEPVSLDDALSNSIMRNVLNAPLNYSNIWYSTNPELNRWVQFYAQLFLAEANVTNYNAQITYDYLTVVRNESPLAKVVTINNFLDMDYPDNLCIETTLSFHVGKGSTYAINTAPLLSITAAWDIVQ